MLLDKLRTDFFLISTLDMQYLSLHRQREALSYKFLEEAVERCISLQEMKRLSHQLGQDDLFLQQRIM